MRIRHSLVLLIVALATSACSPSTSGPSGPVAPDQVTPDDAVKATGARAAAAAFVRAYADDTGSHPTMLAQLVEGDRLIRWVHWLGIQDREFPGTISGEIEDNEIGPASSFELTSVPGSDALLRDVDVRATITFSFTPRSGNVITVSRSLDGPMRLLYDAQRGTWGVLDFTRDGIPLSSSFEIVPDAASLSRGGIDLAIDSFVSVPYWQFFLRAAVNGGAETIAARDVILLGADGRRVASAREVTPSIRVLRGGTTEEGIVTFAPQPTAAGLTLRVTLRGPGSTTTFDFRLRSLIHPLPLASGSPSPTP